MKKNIKRIFLLVATSSAILFLCTLVSNLLFLLLPNTLPNKPVGEFITPVTYKFSPESGFENFDSNVFIMSDAERVGSPYLSSDALPSGTFLWTQVEYLQIAEEYHTFTRGETLDNWVLYVPGGVEFGVSNCHDDIAGFDYAQFIFFKENINTYSVSAINIYPLYQEIHSGGPEYEQERFNHWHGISLSQLAITADDALLIAEGVGGKAVRDSVFDNCRIKVSLISQKYWLVDYRKFNSDGDFSSIFKIKINTQNGNYKTISLQSE
jgi:hypothetical protein